MSQSRWKTKEILKKHRNRWLLRTSIAKTRYVSSEIFEERKQRYMEELFENARNWKENERKTREQSDSELFCELFWLSLRKIMLIASNFGAVCRMRPTTSCTATVKNILFPPSIDTASNEIWSRYGGNGKTEII